MNRVELQEILQATVARRWPNSDILVQVWPLVDLALGDVTTDVCQQLAAQLHCDINSVTEQLLKALGSSFSVPWEAVRGFINFRLSRVSIQPLPFRSINSDLSVITVGVLPNYGVVNVAGFLRLSALGIIQCDLLNASGQPACLWLANQVPVKDDSSFSPVDLVRSAAKLVECAPITLEEIRQWLGGTGDRTQLWCAPGALAQVEFQKLRSMIQAQGGMVQITDRRWLQGRIDDWVDDPLISWGDLELLSAVLLLAGPANGVDLDLVPARLQEKDNLNWYLRTTRDRLVTLLPDRFRQCFNVATLASCKVEHKLSRELILRLGFLSEFIERAAWQGRIVDFVVVLRSYLQTINRVLNDPRLRHDLGEHNLAEEELWPLAAAYQQLDAISERCALF